ncbi:MAG: penicillin-binding protein 2 [Oscillospiraceae bacterium]|jgi:penicillin-binding protein 2|nr:penicillin-binding protein 2 [Oscillospiraceae bacterium]
MEKNIKKRISVIGTLTAVAFAMISIRLCIVATSTSFKTLANNQQTKTFTVAVRYADIYDKDFKPLIYTENESLAVIPVGDNIQLQKADNPPDGTVIFNVPKQLSENQIAQHIIGYELEDEGITGLLGGYNTFLHSYRQEYSISYAVDAKGKIFAGLQGKPFVSEENNVGLVTTIDSKLQEISETVAKKSLSKGAIVVMDVKSGEIRAMVSTPSYSSYDLIQAMGDENNPLINRALRPYSVGSCFKLLIASEALNEGFGHFTYECTGVENVYSQEFHCHKLIGHGEQTMDEAIMNSCNTYFIKLAEQLDPKALRDLAVKFGFGEYAELANGIFSDDGNLPTDKELEIPAELANFSFGQGKLLATPVQICKMTAVIANGGLDISPTLVKGITLDKKTIVGDNDGIKIVERVIDKNIAEKLQYAMKMTNYMNENSNSKTQYTSTGVKTSTAQTGKKNADGDELYNAWITGFFPTDNPQYAITVMYEDGGYGNSVTAPVLKEIIDSYMRT